MVAGNADILRFEEYRAAVDHAVPDPNPQDQRDAATGYVPPVTVILRGLGVTSADLEQKTASVSTSFLRFVISELVRRGPFDPTWYAERYPDVKGAWLAGHLSSLHQHYCTQGYFEGRLPCDLAFDPAWYFSSYSDVSQAFSPADAAALLQHFRSQGLWEGRSGTPAARDEADRWLQALSDER